MYYTSGILTIFFAVLLSLANDIFADLVTQTTQFCYFSL